MMHITADQIREQLRLADKEEFEALKRALSSDTRKTVRDALKSAERRLEAADQEEKRLQSLYEFDYPKSQASSDILVGLDEVGRGAIAGPLAVGAVILDRRKPVANLNDSKQLSPALREEVCQDIKNSALAWSVFYVSPSDIDKNGMAQSLRCAFSGALHDIEAAGIVPDRVFIDGNPLHIDPRERAIVKGDTKSASIAAASIVAKVTRDALMSQYDSSYPVYDFAHNKGYAAQAHIQAIKSGGLSPLHRESFCRSFLQTSLF